MTGLVTLLLRRLPVVTIAAILLSALSGFAYLLGRSHEHTRCLEATRETERRLHQREQEMWNDASRTDSALAGRLRELLRATQPLGEEIRRRASPGTGQECRLDPALVRLLAKKRGLANAAAARSGQRRDPLPAGSAPP